MSAIRRPDLAIIAGAGLALGAVSGVSIGAALTLGPPWNLGAAGAALFTGAMAAVSLTTWGRFMLHLAPEPTAAPEVDTPATRPRWAVAESANAFEIDVLPQLAPTKTLLIRAQPTLTADDPLTHLDLAWVLWRAYTLGKPTRAEFVGKKLPSLRRLTRTRYEETVDLLTRAGIIIDRGNGYAGRWAPGLTLTEALEAAGIDHRTLPILTWEPGYTWPGLARTGTSSLKLLTTKIIDEGG